jgi:predicted DNA-binding protein (UPF0251 family)
MASKGLPAYIEARVYVGQTPHVRRGLYPCQTPNHETEALLSIPTSSGVRSVYADLERSMFGSDDPDRIAEILALARAQMSDDVSKDRPQKLEGGRVHPVDPEVFERMVPEGAPMKIHGRYRQQRRRLLPTYREKTARQLAEDELLRAGLAPILSDLTVAQADALRHVHWYSLPYREAAARLGVATTSLTQRLNSAYRKIRAAIPVIDYRAVREYLISAGRALAAREAA